MRGGRKAGWASVAFAVAASAALIALPSGTTVSTSSSAGAPSSTVVRHHTLLEHEGSSVLPVLAVPVLVSAIGALLDRRLARMTAASLLWGFSVVGAASIGLLYAPAALAMTVAAFLGAETTK